MLDQWQIGTDGTLATLSLASTADGGACAAREIGPTWAFLVLRPGSVELTTPSPNGERAAAVFPRLDGSGCWALTTSSVYSLSLAGVITPVATNVFTGMSGLVSTQHLDGSIWVAMRAGLSPRLMRIDVDGTVTTITTSVTLLDGLAPDPAGGVFAHSSATKRFLHVAPDGTMTPLDGPPIQSIGAQAGGGPSSLVFDPGDATLYVIDSGAAQIAALRKEGNQLVAGPVATVPSVTLREATNLDSFPQILFDPRRRQVFAGVTTLNDTLVEIDAHVALLPLHFRRLTLLPLPPQGLLAGYEPTRGSLWSASQSADGNAVSNAVRRIADDGTVLASISQPLAPFDVEPLPDGGAWIAAATTTSGTPVATRLFRVAGDGSIVAEGTLPLALAAISVWQDEDTLCGAVATTSTTAALTRIDTGTMSSETLTYTRVAGAAIVPVAAADGSCWFVERQVSLGLAKLVRFDAGSLTSVFAPISTVDAVGWRLGGAATDPRDGSVWVSDVSGGRVLHMAPNGTKVTSWAVGVGANGPTVRAIANGSLEVWWVVNASATVEVHRSPDGASPAASSRVVTLPYGGVTSMEVLGP